MDEMNEKNPADEGEGELEVKSATERDPAGSQHVTRRGTYTAERPHCNTERRCGAAQARGLGAEMPGVASRYLSPHEMRQLHGCAMPVLPPLSPRLDPVVGQRTTEPLR
jgi:hypothetical protein